jgi:hypothetical protein
MPPIVIPDAFKRTLRKKTPAMQAAVAECVARLGENPRHPSLQTHPVRGVRGGGVFEAYIDQANRLTFHWDGAAIVLRNNCNHTVIDRSP